MPQPFVKSIQYQDVIEYVLKLPQDTGLVVLESCAQHKVQQGRYSFIAYDPFATLTYQFDKICLNDELIAESDIFEVIQGLLNQYNLQAHNNYPPFQGGIAGIFTYDLVRAIESLADVAEDDMQIPSLQLGLYDLVIAFDHKLKKTFIFSSGFPETRPHKRELRAQKRLDECINYLQTPAKSISSRHNKIDASTITSNFTQKSYCAAVNKIKSYILAGDIFEANLSQRFQCQLPPTFSTVGLYKNLRRENPAPFSGYVRMGETVIVSSSPERFLRLHKQQVEARPIKGTCKRSQDAEEDAYLARQLQKSEKDRAENTMIVDLMRNDLSKVCKPNSIRVPQYCGLESFETVHHLVSVVQGELAEGYTACDLLKAAFPGGSITGAPKIRAMEIIEELESVRRGPYCGSLGYIGFDNSMDLSILIRSYVIKKNKLTFHAGGAIVLDSNAQQEYFETLIKAKALKKALLCECVSKQEVVT